jgi:hypothetical protein
MKSAALATGYPASVTVCVDIDDQPAGFNVLEKRLNKQTV